jgi:ATP-dependent DNA helicase RecG
MTEAEVKTLIRKGEDIRIEFKECTYDVPSSFYETVCSFMNKEGGTILLGVKDNGIIEGVDHAKSSQIIKNIITAVNDRSLINPPTSVQPIPVLTDNKIIIVVKLSVSSQVHTCRDIVYDRQDDADLRITDDARIKEIYFRKRQIFTENQIYPHLSLNDLDENLFERAHNLIREIDPGHPWLSLSNDEILRSSALHRRDFQTGEEGLSLAAALIFGKDVTIQNILPAYKVEAMVRIKNLDRWDDRITLRTNLIDTYISLMAFVKKHLEDRFYILDGQRLNLRELIFRELIGNIIVHREYTNAFATELVIYKNKVEATNPNRVVFRGPLNIQTFSPYAKNPNLRRFFTAFGWTDEIGSGIRNITNYLQYYTPGAIPLFLEDDIFRTEIPLKQSYLAALEPQLLELLQLDGLRDELNKDLNAIALNSDIEGEDKDAALKRLVSRWHDEGIRMQNLDWMIINDLTDSSWGKVSGWNEKGIRFIGRKGLYILQLLILCLQPASMEELLNAFSYSNRGSFRERYVLPMLVEGLLERTIKDKPSSKLQRYVTTEKGRFFLGGTRINE